MAEYRRRQPRTMSDLERFETIAKLRRQGWTYAKIGEVVGLSANGAKYALHKVTQPGRTTSTARKRSNRWAQAPRSGEA